MRGSRVVPIFVAMCASAGALAQLHKWVDDKGVTHYSDRPPVNAPSTAVTASGTPTAPYPDTMVPVSARPATSPGAARATSEADRKSESRSRVPPAER
jgi:hypothetical protein